MIRRFRRKPFLQLFLLMAAGRIVLASPILSLPDAGIISGAPGTTTGFGFKVTNASDWLVITSFNFDPSSPQVSGYFTDCTQYNFVVVGPRPESPAVTQAWQRGREDRGGEFFDRRERNRG